MGEHQAMDLSKSKLPITNIFKSYANEIKLMVYAYFRIGHFISQLHLGGYVSSCLDYTLIKIRKWGEL